MGDRRQRMGSQLFTPATPPGTHHNETADRRKRGRGEREGERKREGEREREVRGELQ